MVKLSLTMVFVLFNTWTGNEDREVDCILLLLAHELVKNLRHNEQIFKMDEKWRE